MVVALSNMLIDWSVSGSPMAWPATHEDHARLDEILGTDERLCILPALPFTTLPAIFSVSKCLRSEVNVVLSSYGLQKLGVDEVCLVLKQTSHNALFRMRAVNRSLRKLAEAMMATRFSARLQSPGAMLQAVQMIFQTPLGIADELAYINHQGEQMTYQDVWRLYQPWAGHHGYQWLAKQLLKMRRRLDRLNAWLRRGETRWGDFIAADADPVARCLVGRVNSLRCGKGGVTAVILALKRMEGGLQLLDGNLTDNAKLQTIFRPPTFHVERTAIIIIARRLAPWRSFHGAAPPVARIVNRGVADGEHEMLENLALMIAEIAGLQAWQLGWW